MSQIWGAQGDLEDNDAMTCVVYDTIHDFGYMVGYIKEVSDLNNLIGPYLPDNAVNTDAYGDRDMLIIKFDNSGSLYWALTVGGAKDDTPTAACIDHLGNLYVVGGYKANLNLNSLNGNNGVTLPDDGGGATTSEAIVFSYDPNGQFRWARSEGGSGDDAFHGITNTSSGVVAIGHFFENNNETLQGITVTSVNDDTDLFIAKYAHNGANAWILAGGSQEADYNTAFNLEESRWDITSYNDTVYFAGLFNGLDFNFDYATNTTSTNTSLTVTSLENDADYVFGAIDATGKLVWLQKQLHHTATDTKTISIAADCNGVFLGGVAQVFLVWEGPNPGWKTTSGWNDMFVAKYNKLTGAPENFLMMSNAGFDNDIIFDIATDRIGNVYLTGTTRGALNVGGTVTQTFTSGAAYILSVNSNLVYQSIAHINSTSNLDVGFGLCREYNGRLFMVGTSNGDLIAGQNSSNISYDGFIVNFAVGAITSTSCCSSGQFVCPTSPQTISINSGCTAPLPDYVGAYNSLVSCPSALITQSPAPGTLLNIGSHTITFLRNNIAVCTTTCVINETVRPTMTNPGNQVLVLNSACSGVLGDYRNLFNATDNCTPAASLTVVQSPAPGTAVNGVSAINVSVTATDQSGNSRVAWITVVPRPSQGPILTNCPSNITVNAGPTCSAAVSFAVPAVAPRCGTCFGPTTLSGFTYMGTFNNNKYFRSNSSTTWHVADSIAYARGGHLATISSAAENAFITSNTANVKHWIGFTDEVTNNNFFWTNGEPISYTNWNDGEPNNLTGTQMYALINHTVPGEWDDEDPTDSYRYIIEFDCPNLTLTNGLALGSNFPVGTTNQIFTATDQYGQSTTCSFNVNVADNIPPSITCPTTQQLSLNATCAGELADYRSLATVADNCTTAANILVTQSPAAGTPVTGVGTTVITLTATDASGNSSSCTFNVNRVDNTPPAISCPGVQTLTLNSSCTATLGDYRSLATRSDNCTTAASINVTQSPAPGTTVTGAGITAVTLTATDAAGNSSTCSFEVNRVDLTPPSILCPGNQIVSLETNCVTNLPDYTSAAIRSDNCSTSAVLTVSQLPAPGTVLIGPGVTTVTLTAIDESGLVDTCMFEVTRVDNTAPTVTCPGTQILNLANNCTATLPNYLTQVIVSDNCSAPNSLVLTQSPPAGTILTGAGTTMVTITATDASNLSGTCTFSVNRVDNTPPSITCPSAQTLTLNTSCAGTLGDYRSLATVSDNCTATASIILTQSPNAGTTVNGPGTTIVTLTATDAAGISTSCTFNVNRVDNIAPSITCPATQTLALNASCSASLGDYRSLATPGDNCTSAANIVVSQSPAPGTVLTGVGTTIVTLTATDAAGNSNSCTFNVNRVDNTPPSITCPSNQTLVLDGSCEINLPNYKSLATKSDNCTPTSSLVVTQSPSVGTEVSGVGTTVVTLTVTDASGNSSSCSFSVFRADNTPPSITCPGNQTVPSTGACSGVLGNYVSMVSKSDNCTSNNGITVSQSPAAGTVITTATTVTMTATDASGNTATCTFLVTPVDNVPPSITCPSAQTLVLNASCTAVLGDYRALATKTDNCTPTASIVVTQNPSAGTTVNGTGTTTVTLTAIDAAGNSSSCTFNVNRVDNTPPSITCPSAQTLVLNASCNATLSDYRSLATVSENCSSGSLTITQTPAPGTTVTGTGTTVVTLTATDASGNSSSCTFNVNRVDNTPPSITCPSAQTLALNGSCSATLGDYRTLATKTDNCTSSASIVVTQSPSPGTIVSGSGTTVVTLTATDAAGNSSSCTFNVNRIDNTPPSITCPSSQTLALNGSCTAALGDYRSLATKSDNCTAATNIVVTQSPAPSSTVNGTGTTVVTLTATDAAGNSSSCTFNVNRVDNTPPSITCPGNQTVPSTGTCAGVMGNYISQVTVSDNCSAAANITITQSPIAGSTITAATQVTMTATDANGNTATCTFLVTPVDNVPPSITCPSAQTLALNASCTAALGDYRSLATKSDNCTPAASIVVTQSPVAGTSVNGTGTTVVTLTATDAAGNSSSCTFNVNRIDNTPPSIACPSAQTLNLNTSCTAALSDYRSLATVTDNCSSGSLTAVQSPAVGTTVTGTGTTVVTLTATDAAGNSSSCTFNVNRVDNIPPTITCPSAQTLALNASCTAALGDYRSLATKADNCTSAASIVVTQSPAVGTTVTGTGTTVVTLTATDAAGNSSSCSFNVNRIDNTPPSITCPSAQTLVLNSSCTAALADYRSLATKSDNCTAATNIVVTQSPAPGSTVNGTGTTVVTLTATDAAGNSSSCTFNVNRVDTTPPLVNCPADQYKILNTNCTYTVADFTPFVTANDNCTTAENLVITQTPAAGTSIEGAGATTVEIIVTDANGNSSTCTFVIHTIDQTAPLLSCLDTQVIELDGACEVLLPDYTETIEVSSVCADLEGIVLVQSPPAGTLLSGVGSWDITITATKPSGASSNCSFLVSTVDFIAPDLTCPSEHVQLYSNENCLFVIPDMHEFVDASDNCVNQEEELFFEQSIPMGAVYEVPGIYPITIEVADGTGNTNTCTVQLEFTLNENLVVVCPDSIALLLDAECAMTLGDYTNLGVAYQPCGATSEIAWSQTPAPGTFAWPEEISALTLTASSLTYGNASCEVPIRTAADLTLFVQCPSDTTLYSTASCSNEVPDFGSTLLLPNACIAEDSWSYDQTPAAGTAISSDETVVTDIFYLDQHVTCTTAIHWIDNIAPAMVCPDTVFTTTPVDCQQQVPAVLSAFSASDNCTLDQDLSWTQTPEAGSFIAESGLLTVVVYDDAGLSATCIATLETVSLENPELVCPSTSLLLIDEACAYIVDDVVAQATLQSECFDALEWSQEPAVNTPWIGDYDNIQITVTLDNGQTLQCMVDVEIPQPIAELTCPTHVEQNFTPLCENYLYDFTQEVNIDYNCTNAADYVLTQIPSAEIVLNDNTLENITFQLSAADGIIATCTSSIIYVSSSDYTIDCPSSWTVTANNTCTYTMPAIEGEVLNSCGVVVETLTNANTTSGANYSIDDFSSIELVSPSHPEWNCSVDLIFEVELPEFACPNDTVIYLSEEAYVLGDLRPWITTESCDGILWNSIQSPQPGSLLSENTTVLMTFNSANGEDQTCTFEIHFEWINNPVQVLCPDTVEVPMTLNCGIQDIDIINAINAIPVITESPYSWNFMNNDGYYEEALTLDLVVTTEGDGQAGCTVVFQPIDTQVPTIIALEESIELVADNNCQYLVPDLTTAVYTTDNCSYQITQSPASGSVISETTTVEMVITDGAGLSASTSIALIPLSSGTPTLPQLDDLTLYIDPLTCSAEYNWLDLLNALGGCASASVGTTLPYTNTYEVGVYTLGYFGLNEMGESGDTSYFQLQVLDVAAPIIQPVPNDIIHLCTTDQTWDLPTMIDCSGYTYTVTNTPLQVGDNPMTLTATDSYNNMTSYSFVISIPEVQWPSIIENTTYCVNATPIALPDTNFDSIIWFIDGAEIGQEIDPAQYEAGTYDLVGEAVIEGCPIDTTISISILALPTSEGLLSNYQVCGNSLSMYWDTDATTIQWTTDASSSVEYVPDAINIAMDTYGNHLFEVVYANDNCTASAKFEVMNDEPIALVDAGANQVIAFGLEAQLLGSCSVDNYAWSSEDGSIIIAQISDLNTMIEVQEAGVYDLLLTANNGLCTASDTVEIAFTGLLVPNTITPNGDRFNDTFVIPGDQVAPVWLRLVNRWGQVVYENENYLNDWSGQNNDGDPLPADTYFYEFKVADIQQTGFIQIQR